MNHSSHTILRLALAVVTAFVTIWGASGVASADITLDLQKFHPTPFKDKGFNAFDGITMGKYQYNLSIIEEYQHEPLIYENLDGDKIREVLSSQLTTHLGGSYGFFDWLDVGLTLPVINYQGGEGYIGGPEPSVFGIGDLRVLPRFGVWSAKDDDSSMGVAIIPVVTLPTGQLIDPYMGSASVTFTPMVAFTMTHHEFSATANLGFKIVEDQTIEGVEVGDQIDYRLGLSYTAIPKKLDVIGEIYGGIAAADPFDTSKESPMDLLAGVKYHVNKDLLVQGGAGMGTTLGVGTPLFRVFAGVAWSPAPPSDRDKDGLLDEQDACPDDPEDKDGFEDAEGCPDPDNDKDGVCDPWVKGSAKYTSLCSGSDECPDDPEDKDGFEDADGCPDPDNDKDGILDVDDECPNIPEDKDGFEDDDGCPDPDNDKDKICDPWVDKDGKLAEYASTCKASDKCPDVPENINGYQDEDGCKDEKPKKVVLEDKKIIIPQVYFVFDKTKLTKPSEKVIDDVAKLLKAHPEIKKVRIEGHTDSHGTDEYNKKLSQGRADAIKKYLIKKGIIKSMLTAVGKGESEPLITPEVTDDDAQTNRRVEFVILEKDDSLKIEKTK